jgi:putative ABC transport system substrate-binding protein
MDELWSSGRKLEPVYYDLEEAEGEEKELADKINGEKPDLIFALGTEAALFAKKNLDDIPIIFSMVLNPVKSGIAESLQVPGDNITGVCLNIPVELQFKKLKEIIPDIKRIGYLYDAHKKSVLKDAARQAADKLGLQMISRPIYSREDVPQELSIIIREADCLWAEIDPLVYSPQSARHIILETLKARLPFMAFSFPYVKAGALLAMECDYYDIGKQSAQTAIKILEGQKPGSIPVALPRETRLAINRRTARTIRLTIPEKSLDKADKIFGGGK